MTNISQVRRQPSREVQQPAQSHTATKWKSWDLNPGRPAKLPTVSAFSANLLNPCQSLTATITVDYPVPYKHTTVYYSDKHRANVPQQTECKVGRSLKDGIPALGRLQQEGQEKLSLKANKRRWQSVAHRQD